MAIVFQTPIVQDKLHMYVGLDNADYDACTEDDHGKVDDHDLNVKFGGALSDIYAYDLSPH